MGEELKHSYWLTRIVLLRYISFVYGVAFLIALLQNRSLIGSQGLLPASSWLDRVLQYNKNNRWESARMIPSLLWMVDYRTHLDWYLDAISITGLLLSGFVFWTGAANMFVMAGLWTLYHSIVGVGQDWYSFGWESQLLESGFIAILLCPVLSLNQMPTRSPTPRVALWAYRWLIVRIMMGAGLIKIRGDQCWRDLTCMNYHYQTQPVPNPLSYYLHQSPEVIHTMETGGNHFIELVAPVLLILPRPFKIVGGWIQIMFQMVLILSGNLSFLNWLTILPSLACFDDYSLSGVFSTRTLQSVLVRTRASKERGRVVGEYIRGFFNLSMAALIAYLSVPVVQNLMSSQQAMNTSFDSLRLVNSYGAFGSVTKTRYEMVLEGTESASASDSAAVWREYEFNCKPGSVTRRPCIISPYHYRLDWIMWFCGFDERRLSSDWFRRFLAKLLRNDEVATSMLAHNPFETSEPPRWIRVKKYEYTYTKVRSSEAQKGMWWNRKYVGVQVPPMSLKKLSKYL